MLGKTKRETSQIIKEIFKVRFRSAGKFKISEISLIEASTEFEIYSFNLKCEFKMEPYSYNYLIKFYLTTEGEQEAQKEFEIIKNIEMDKPYPSRDYHLDFTKTMFIYPFIIINKDDNERVDYILSKSEKNP